LFFNSVTYWKVPNTHWHGCTAFYFPIFSIIGNSFYFDIIWTINTPSNRKFSYIMPNAAWFRSMLSCLQVCLHSSSSGLPPLFWHYRFPTNENGIGKRIENQTAKQTTLETSINKPVSTLCFLQYDQPASPSNRYFF